MSFYKSTEENIPTHTEAYYEELASQEELYLEEMEEEVRAILISYDPSRSPNRSIVIEVCGEGVPDLDVKVSTTDPKNNPRIVRSLDEQLVDASEELITGDADDPPLSEQAVQEMLNDSPARGSDLCVTLEGNARFSGPGSASFH